MDTGGHLPHRLLPTLGDLLPDAALRDRKKYGGFPNRKRGGRNRGILARRARNLIAVLRGIESEAALSQHRKLGQSKPSLRVLYPPNQQSHQQRVHHLPRLAMQLFDAPENAPLPELLLRQFHVSPL